MSFSHDGDSASFITDVTSTGEAGAAASPAGPPRAERDSKPEREPRSERSDAGRKLGRYQLCFELASGGMATVYLARVRGPGGFEKLVALKRIHGHLAERPEFVEMFLDEARIASRIDHPNACRVFDFGEADGTYYLAMEYVLGEPVSSVLRRVMRSPRLHADAKWPGLAARIVADACEGLHAAHELTDDGGRPVDLVHRDISPQNLLVTYDGTTTVMDFGIAHALGRLHETRQNRLKGTLPYMSPEQGKRLPLDRRADIWSLGVVLWELVAGKRLFHRASAVETINAVMSEPISAPSSARPGTPAELDRIVQKALARDREDRYPTARELGRDLARFIAAQGEAVTTADLSDWMRDAFRDEHARRRELIDQARRMRGKGVPRVSPRLGGREDGADSGVESDAPAIGGGVSRPGWARAGRAGALAVVVALVSAAAVLVMRAGGDETSRRSRDGRQSSREPSSEESGGGRPSPARAEQPVAPAPAPNPPDDEAALPEVEPDTSARPAPHATGRVSIATPGGWADVYLGHERLGRAPGQLRMRVGHHLLTLLPFAHGPARQVPVNVRPSGTARLVVRLD